MTAPTSAAHRAPRPTTPRVVFALGTLAAAVWMFLGAWQRRWIADDGLIVLRTVRNLLAGNGPVFNAGERVEANTSTVWTYLVYASAWVSGARLEYVALTLALVLSTAAVVFAMLGTAKLYRGTLGPGALLLPAGVLVYIALPPARDFATSGLESALVIAWIGGLWWWLQHWAATAEPGAAGIVAFSVYAGLAPLVRPELALIGVGALAVVFLAPGLSVRLRIAMVVAALVIPGGYQIWRMGYYGLPYPNTAVAKDAGGAKWGQGFTYLGNLVSPYWLWLPVLALAALAVALWLRTRTSAARTGSLITRLRSWLHSPSAVVVLFVASGIVLALYSIRVGGDFMHGRVLLPPLFMLLAPVAVLPLPRPVAAGAPRRLLPTAVSGAVLVGTVAWAAVIATGPGLRDGTTVGHTGIVDERAFYTANTGHAHPIRATDYLDYPRIRSMVDAIDAHPEGGLFLPSPPETMWWYVPPAGATFPGQLPHTIWFLNLGMTSMNVSLRDRVIDQMGLAYPIAAHTERLDDGRIGHDKLLYPDWAVADSGVASTQPWLPEFFDEDWVAQAKVALTCEGTQHLLESTRSELTWARFKQNVKNAFSLAKYRIDRVPAYELQRCGLPEPEPVVHP